MIETNGQDIWDLHAQGYWICVTTNGYVRSDGRCVMGRGIAWQAKEKFPKLPLELGNRIKIGGNEVHVFPEYQLISFPVKHVWFEKADIELIKRSCRRLSSLMQHETFSKVASVRPGCGNGGLSWDEVKPVIEPLLPENFMIVEWGL